MDWEATTFEGCGLAGHNLVGASVPISANFDMHRPQFSILAEFGAAAPSSTCEFIGFCFAIQRFFEVLPPLEPFVLPPPRVGLKPNGPQSARVIESLSPPRSAATTLPGTGWYTNAVIQNASNFPSTVKLTATWKKGSVNPPASVQVTLGAHESVVFRIDNTGPAGTIGIPEIANKQFEGSLLLESTQRMAVVVQLGNAPTGSLGASGGTAKAFYSGLYLSTNGYDTGQNLIYSNFKSDFAGKSTTLFVQNTSPNSGNATLTVRANDGNRYVAQVVLGPRQSAAYHPSDFKHETTGSAAANITVTLRGIMDPPNPASGHTYTYIFPDVQPRSSVAANPWLNTLGGLPLGGLAAATIDATHPILANVTEGGYGMPEYAFQCESASDNELIAPLIKFEYPNATNASSANSEVSIQNTGSTPATITGTFTCRAAGSNVFSTYTVVKTAPAGTAAVFTKVSVPSIPSGRLCSAVFTSASVNMVGTVTETTRGLSIPQMDDANYELVRFD